MPQYIYFKNAKSLNSEKTYCNSFVFLIYFPCWVYATTVSFFVFNNENSIKNVNTGSSSSYIIELQPKPTDWFIEEDKISLFKNNILCFKSGEETKYYNPTILTIPCPNKILLNPIFSKTSFESKQTNIKIFLKDVSYSALLLFLKLIDHPDIIINQIKIQEFIDILMIISVLDIEKSKERNIFLKELFRNFMFAMENGNEYFNFEKYCESYHYKHIKKSVLMDLLILYFDLITFNDKSAERYIVLSGKKLGFNCDTKYFTSYNLFKKAIKDEINLCLDEISLQILFRMMNIKHLMNIWKFIVNIIRLDLLYLIFSNEEICNKAILLFSYKIFQTEKLYIRYNKNLSNFLFKQTKINIFWENLKVIKLESNFTIEELNKVLGLCGYIQKLTLMIEPLNFEKLSLLVDFTVKNPDKICKAIKSNYDYINSEHNSLLLIPNNLLCFVKIIEDGSSNTVTPQFLHRHEYNYTHIEDTKFATNFLLFECSKIRSLKLRFQNNSVPFKFRKLDFTSLRYFKSIKYFLVQNIVICNELLMYVLESNTMVLLKIVGFVCAYNGKCFEKNNIINTKLQSLCLINPLDFIDTSLLIYLRNFKSVADLKFENVFVESSPSYSKRIYQYIFGSKEKIDKKIEEKINLKRLEIIDVLVVDNSNILYLLSKTYDFSALIKLTYRVNILIETEYFFFSNMERLEVITIDVRNPNEYINLKRLFNNRNLFSTVAMLYVYVSKIQKEDIEFFKSFRNLTFLCLSCAQMDQEIVSKLKKNDFFHVKLKIILPIQNKQLQEIKNYMETEFGIYSLEVK
ncbi:hypothetical protein CWI38_0111p0040 [Hamiltosporidium tvaerminnensis]|uniref:Uncharacterized protein n=1 Tax=Hamiltosporidium tvaerminnensis TaxID=1176355 RepID=A0A4Q9M3D0_9MICR|nr:hypothetical protein CWI38_0111p0040 [Hamiltosporidium tvaerminnensis]